MLKLYDDFEVWMRRNRYGRFRPAGWRTTFEQQQRLEHRRRQGGVGWLPGSVHGLGPGQGRALPLRGSAPGQRDADSTAAAGGAGAGMPTSRSVPINLHEQRRGARPSAATVAEPHSPWLTLASVPGSPHPAQAPSSLATRGSAESSSVSGQALDQAPAITHSGAESAASGLSRSSSVSYQAISTAGAPDAESSPHTRPSYPAAAHTPLSAASQQTSASGMRSGGFGPSPDRTGAGSAWRDVWQYAIRSVLYDLRMRRCATNAPRCVPLTRAAMVLLSMWCFASRFCIALVRVALGPRAAAHACRCQLCTFICCALQPCLLPILLLLRPPLLAAGKCTSSASCAASTLLCTAPAWRRSAQLLSLPGHSRTAPPRTPLTTASLTWTL